LYEPIKPKITKIRKNTPTTMAPALHEYQQDFKKNLKEERIKEKKWERRMN
jgi:hypothetical protein